MESKRLFFVAHLSSDQLTLVTQEVQVDQILPIGRIGNPESMDHPKDRYLFGLGPQGYLVHIRTIQSNCIGVSFAINAHRKHPN